jgi:hypothetical protein
MFAAALFTVAVIELAAQAPQTSQPGASGTSAPPASQSGASTSAPASPASAAADKVMLTGCVARMDQTSGGAASTAASSESIRFVLNNAMRSTPTATTTTGTTGSSASSAPSATAGSAAMTYRLDATDSQLTAHVGHKVEVTGMLQNAAAAGTTGSSAGSTAATNSPVFKVESVRMIAATCTP